MTMVGDGTNAPIRIGRAVPGTIQTLLWWWKILITRKFTNQTCGLEDDEVNDVILVFESVLACC
jgi:hypothetical protein